MSTIRLILVALVLVSAPFATAAETPGPKKSAAIEKAVLACYDEMMVRAEAGDVDGLFGSVAETNKGALIRNGQLFLTRDDALATTREGFRGIKSIKYTISERHVSVLSTTSAVLNVLGSANAVIDDGRTISSSFAQTVVFVFRDGKWRVLHTHQSSPR